MTTPFSVRTTPHFDRLLKKLSRQHPDLIERLAAAADILRADPYNRSRAHSIKKLEGVKPGEGQSASGLAAGVFVMTSADRKSS